MTKETEPDRPGKQLLKESKAKEKQSKKETKMKNLKNNSTFKTVMHVVLTLVTLATIAGLILFGWNLRGGYEADNDARIKSEVDAKVLSLTSKAESLK